MFNLTGIQFLFGSAAADRAFGLWFVALIIGAAVVYFGLRFLFGWIIADDPDPEPTHPTPNPNWDILDETLDGYPPIDPADDSSYKSYGGTRYDLETRRLR